MKNKKTLYHFVLDRSGSMRNCVEETLDCFNTQLEVIKSLQNEYPDQDILMSFTVFNQEVETIFTQRVVDNFEEITKQMFRPNGLTALLDAIGISINQIKIQNETEITKKEISIVMLILTDGYENASKEFTYHQIAKMIKELEETDHWTFTFLGADIDAKHTSKMININEKNVRSFNKNEYNSIVNELSYGFRNYTHSKSTGKINKDFFDKNPNEDKE
jgi:hypothetical protein